MVGWGRPLLALRRRDDGHKGHAGHLGRNGGHQHRTGQRRGAAGDVDAHPLDGTHQLAERAFGVVVDPTDGRLATVKGFDPCSRLAQGGHNLFVHLLVGGGNLFGADDQGDGFHTIQGFSPADQRGVAVGPHIGQDATHDRFRRQAFAKEALNAVEQRFGHIHFVPGAATQHRVLGRRNIQDTHSFSILRYCGDLWDSTCPR